MFSYALVVVCAFLSSQQAYGQYLWGKGYDMPEIRASDFANNMLIRDLLERMTGGEMEDQDSYLDTGSSYVRGMPDKEIPIELPIDYDGIDTPLNPKTSIRDQEYLQHSTLWSHQQPLNNYKPNDRHNAKQVSKNKAKDGKTESQLPAYCTPPNPCPVGYTSENDCIENFENSAGFSRDYQSAQDCMCDSEHMLHCPESEDSENGIQIDNEDFDQIVDRIEEDNPFFRGEKLPIAAKKGINVGF